VDFDHSPKVQALQKKLNAFMKQHVYPNEQRYKDEVNAGDRWQAPALIDELKRRRASRSSGTCFCRIPSAARG
jgi:acyl-CoA dehydrogenase